MKNNDLCKKARMLEKRMDKLGEQISRLWDQERTAVIKLEQKCRDKAVRLSKKREQLKKELSELQNSCKSRFHPKLDVVGTAKCPDCGLVRREEPDYSAEAHT